MKAQTQILLIEHETERVNYEYAIRQAGGQVILIEEYDEKKIEDSLKSNYFDFIITDAFFLPKDVNHDDPKEELDKYRLPEIIKLIRKYDRRVKIIVYTGYNEKLLTDDLTEVDFLFDKEYIKADMFVWQLKRLIQTSLSSNNYEHALVKELLIFLSKDDNQIWKEQIEQMLKDYRNGISESDQYEEILKSLYQVLLISFSDSENYKELLNYVRDFEKLNLAGSPKNFGHLRHVINVFWLGYYILNKLLIKNPIINNSISLLDMNKSWLITSLFHDIGHFGENYEKLTGKIIELLKVYPHSDNKLSINTDLNFSLDNGKMEAFKSIIAGSNPDLQELITTNTKNKFDHGILSAMTLYKHLFNGDIDIRIKEDALQAISFHNIFEKNIEFIEKQPFEKYPLLNLLILCDHLETWDRETGFESKFDNKTKIEKIELIDLKSENNILIIRVNYQMFRAFIPSNEVETERLLIELIITNIKPLLEKINFNSVLKMEIEFLLNYRKALYNWSNYKK